MSIFVFTGGGYPEPSAVACYFQQPPDYVLAADSGLTAAEKYAVYYKFSVNEIHGDMDSLLEPNRRLAAYPAASIHRYQADKDYPDTELALQAAWNRKYRPEQKIILIGGDGGRIDHLFALKELCSSPCAPDIWLCNNRQTVFCLSDTPGRTAGMEYSATAGTIVSVFPTGQIKKDQRIRGQGLYWPIENLAWSRGEYSLSNRAADNASGCFSLTAECGSFIVIVTVPETE